MPGKPVYGLGRVELEEGKSWQGCARQELWRAQTRLSRQGWRPDAGSAEVSTEWRGKQTQTFG